jgi:hypothetical protein
MQACGWDIDSATSLYMDGGMSPGRSPAKVGSNVCSSLPELIC